jgi:hypothetical protein
MENMQQLHLIFEKNEEINLTNQSQVGTDKDIGIHPVAVQVDLHRAFVGYFQVFFEVPAILPPVTVL